MVHERIPKGSQQKFVITGGPSTGKSSLLDALGTRGYHIVPEAARAIIEEEQAKARATHGYVPLTPSSQPFAFQSYCLQRILKHEEVANGHSPAFCDRGVGDIDGYTRALGVNLPDGFHDAFERAGYTAVFFLEQLAVYVKDDVRKEDAALAARIHGLIREGYVALCAKYGLPLVDVPTWRLPKEADVAKRVHFILEQTGLG